MEAMEGMIENFMSELKNKFREMSEGESFVDTVKGFVNAIDWKEPWLICLISGEALLLLIALTLRRKTNLQTVLFFCLLGIIFLAERVNTFARENWKLFSKQNYFDPAGLFISIVVSLPLLLICIVLLINGLISTVELMIKWKRAELKHRARQANKEAKKNE